MPNKAENDFDEIKAWLTKANHQAVRHKLENMPQEQAEELAQFQDGDGKTLLHHAAAKTQDTEDLDYSVRYLASAMIRNGNKNAQDNKGMTALMCAMKNSNFHFAWYFLNLDFDCLIEDNRGKIVLDYYNEVVMQRVRGESEYQKLFYRFVSDIDEPKKTFYKLINKVMTQKFTEVKSELEATDEKKLKELVSLRDGNGMTLVDYLAKSGNGSEDEKAIVGLLESAMFLESEDRELEMDSVEWSKIEPTVASDDDGGSVEQEPSNTSYYAKLFGSVALITLGIVMASISLPLSPILLAVLVVSFTVVGGIGLFRTFESGMPKEGTISDELAARTQSSEMLRGQDRNAAETQEGDAARSADAEETTDPSQGSGLST